MARSVRMGIDVGGTHTKAVAIDNETHEIIGKSSVKTTHDDKRGVAAGVVKSFENCLKENNIKPEDVIFVAHSTTQATNALIEGDVAKVGVLGMAKGGLESFLAKRQTRLADIDLGNSKKISIVNDFLSTKKMTDDDVEKSLDKLQADGAQVIVSSMAFGVDNGEPEKLVYEAATKRNLPTTMASDITKLYGLTRRTRTAAINASILPKMLDTANSTEASVREAGVTVPLMIMRGDGGVMEISEMKKRPVLTMLSGPAASVMGSLMYLRASNGVYFEVGGTTTNIGVIKNGRPAIDYSIVGGHATYISSLDVRVLGVAGGSMVRANKSGVVDVGPRSAHIAGLDYAVFTDPEKIKGPKVEFFSPKPGDPDDYVRIRLEDGSAVTITNSCAANVLGLVKPEHFSYGNVEAAKKAMQALADYCGTTVEDIATQIMERAYAKIEPVILDLAEKYKLEKDQISLVGVGGGAASLIIYFSNKMGVKYSIPENAEVISSIGVALAMIGVIVCPITSGDTAFRSARLTIADWFGIDQNNYIKRLYLCIPLLGAGALISFLDYQVVWRYFSWTNQTLAMIVLWTASMYLYMEKKCYWLTAVPATFMSAVSMTYFFSAPECLGLSTKIAYPVGIILAVLFLAFFLFVIYKRDPKPDYSTLEANKKKTK